MQLAKPSPSCSLHACSPVTLTLQLRVCAVQSLLACFSVTSHESTSARQPWSLVSQQPQRMTCMDKYSSIYCDEWIPLSRFFFTFMKSKILTPVALHSHVVVWASSVPQRSLGASTVLSTPLLQWVLTQCDFGIREENSGWRARVEALKHQRQHAHTAFI